MAERIVEAYEWACDDPHRAITHNKGIMNGIDGVAIATGQDWRAIEAECHTFATFEKPSYQPLTSYWVEGETLHGQLSLPLMVGTKGGVLGTNPMYKFAMGVMGNPNSQALSGLLVSVGLAQNFAALRALTTEGIQKGHMALHARNIAIAGL